MSLLIPIHTKLYGQICFLTVQGVFLIKISYTLVIRIKSKLLSWPRRIWLLPSLQKNSFLCTIQLFSPISISLLMALCKHLLNTFPFFISPQMPWPPLSSPLISATSGISLFKISSTLLLLLLRQKLCSQILIVSGLKTHWELNPCLIHVFIPHRTWKYQCIDKYW